MPKDRSLEESIRRDLRGTIEKLLTLCERSSEMSNELKHEIKKVVLDMEKIHCKMIAAFAQECEPNCICNRQKVKCKTCSKHLT